MELRPPKDSADVQVNDAMEKEEWRHALQLIEKREKKLKKGQANDWLMACKASVLLMLPEPTKKSQGDSALGVLFEKSPPVVDFNALVILQTSAERRNDLDPRLNTLWTKAANAQPNDEGLHIYWFKKCFWLDDWQGARKVTNDYLWLDAKASSQERTLCGKLAHKWCAKAAEDTPLHKDGVRYRSLSDTAHGQVTEVNKELKNGRVLRTPRDVLFLLDVYESENQHEEALAILDSNRTGIQSRIGKRSWSLVLRKIKLLEYLQNWPVLFRYCFEILNEAGPQNESPEKHGFGEFGDNWSIWTAMVNAASRHRTANFDIADCDNRQLRNTICAMMLARKHLVLLEDNELSRLKSHAALAEDCFTYFALHGGKTFCFSDLKWYLNVLPVVMIQRFFQKATSLLSRVESNSGQNSGKQAPDTTMIMFRVNLSKIDYFTNFTRLQYLKNPENRVNCTRFVADCIRTYNLGIEYCEAMNGGQIGERFPGDDAGLMAAMGLIEMYLEGSYRNGMLQAVTILHHLTCHSPSNYEAFVLLTLLCIRLGAGCIAAEHYHQLSIKNIQLPNTSWILCTRLSTIHPHPPYIRPSISTIEANDDPVAHLSQSLDYHLLLEGKDREELYDFLQLEEYASLIKAMDNTSFTSEGYAKYMLLMERLRTERLSGARPNPKYQLLLGTHKYLREIPYPAILTYQDKLSPNAAIVDNRDTIPVPRWGSPASEPLLDRIILGKWPKAGWLSQQLFIAKAFKSVADTSSLSRKISENGSHVDDMDHQDDTTAQEGMQYNLAQDCISLVLVYKEKLSEGATRRQNGLAILHTLESIERRQREANESMASASTGPDQILWDVTESVAAPDWRFFHTVYIGLDSCILIKSTMDVIEDENRNFQVITPQQVTDRVSTIRKLCEEYRARVHATARGLQNKFSGGKHDSELLTAIIGQAQVSEEDDPITYWIRRIAVPESAVESVVARLCRAWTEALENICKLTAS
ncbi:MAG: hypothetical protein Q9220_006141 [cf. Caloplaca sp. 1 TL-2023]